MRVLHVQKMAGVSGSELYYLNLLPALVTAGVEASFLIVEHPTQRSLNDRFASQLEEAGVRVIRRHYGLPLSWRLIREIAAVVRSGNFDLVQSNLIHADVWLAIVKRVLLPGMTLISAKHGYSEKYPVRHGFNPAHLRPDLFSIATRLAATQADRIVVISRGLGRLLAGGGLVNGSKIECIPYGFSFANPLSRLPSGKARFGTPQVVTVARLTPFKRHDRLFRATARILPKHSELKLVLVGGGPEEANLKTLAKDLGIEDTIIWVGSVDNPHDYLRDSDLFVLPSTSEGFGAVILEAWHNGLPVVSFDVPAQNEIITDGADGFLVEPFNLEQLGDRIGQLIDNPDLRRAMGEHGRETLASRYSTKIMVSATLHLYERLARRT